MSKTISSSIKSSVENYAKVGKNNDLLEVITSDSQNISTSNYLVKKLYCSQKRSK